MNRALRLFFCSFSALFVYCSLVYLLLRYVFQVRLVFGALYRMFLYHHAHPFQYIALFCAIFELVLSLVVCRWPQLRGGWRGLALAGGLLFTVAVASVLGGVLWVIHDMQAGYFPEGERFWSAIFWGAKNGLYLGWLVLVMSVPFNLFSLGGIVAVSRRAWDWAARQSCPAGCP